MLEKRELNIYLVQNFAIKEKQKTKTLLFPIFSPRIYCTHLKDLSVELKDKMADVLSL